MNRFSGRKEIPIPEFRNMPAGRAEAQVIRATALPRVLPAIVCFAIAATMTACVNPSRRIGRPPPDPRKTGGWGAIKLKENEYLMQ